MIIKIHQDKERIILAMCDKEIFGKKFEEQDNLLDLSGDFFDGIEMKLEEIKKFVTQAFIINAVGDNSINLLKKMKIINNKSIKYISSIPTIQVYNI